MRMSAPARACLVTITLVAGLGLPVTGQGVEARASFQSAPRIAVATDRVVVKWRREGLGAVQIDDTVGRTQRLASRSGIALQPVRTIVDRLDVMRLPWVETGTTLQRTLSRLALDPSVEYVEADEPRYALAAPNDPGYVAGSDSYGSWSGQWYLGDPSAATPAATGAVSAWASGTGRNYIIAVLDTGVDFTQPDLGVYNATTAPGNKLLPGYDFICNDTATNCYTTGGSNTYNVANDGNGWDADPTDPGDWLTLAEVSAGGFFHGQGCGGGANHDQALDSSWHGTKVSGIAAAITNNGFGVAGTAPGAYILPVRVLGKCNGYMSDIVAGMYWAAGMSYSGLGTAPTNPYPAQVLNMSLGARTPCTQTEQQAVTAITQAGHLIVAAAGNEGGPVDAPANCSGVLSVAGIRHTGTKVGYSNVSSTSAAISIAAPAGNCVNVNTTHPYALPCVYSIETTTNYGKTTPIAQTPAPGGQVTGQFTYAQVNSTYQGSELNEGSVGTSFATPIVSGVAAMMIEANPQLNAAQLIARLQAGAAPFPVPVTAPAGGTCHVATLATDSTGAYSDIQDSECTCTTATCGAGMLDAVGALAQALRPLAVGTASETVASPGDHITLDGSGSSASNGRSIATWQWSTDPAVSIDNGTAAKATIVFPALRPLKVTLVVTDNAGSSDTTTFTIDSHLGTSKGGGGRLPAWALALLALGLLARAARATRPLLRN